MVRAIVYFEKVCSRSTLGHLHNFSIGIVKAIRLWPRAVLDWALRLQTFLEQTIVQTRKSRMAVSKWSKCSVREVTAAVHWLCVGAIIAKFNMGGYQYALSL